MLTTLLLALTLAADPAIDRCTADIAKADRDLATASDVFLTCSTPDSCNVARALLATTMERKRTAEASCTVVVDKRLEKRLAKWAKLKERSRPKRVVVLGPTIEADPFELEELPAAPVLVPVPGVPWLVDPVVEKECPGLLCPIVVVVQPDTRR